jgi:hypothetical protein
VETRRRLQTVIFVVVHGQLGSWLSEWRRKKPGVAQGMACQLLDSVDDVDKYELRTGQEQDKSGTEKTIF